MAFYLFKANYTADSIKAMISEPQDREAAGRKIIEAIGGKLHHFFIALGDSDAIAIIEAPDDIAMVAGSLIVSASGGLTNVSTTKLLTMPEAMEAMGKARDVASAYVPPTG